MATCLGGPATYTLQFSSEWRADTHPQRYPGRDAAFSAIAMALGRHLFRIGERFNPNLTFSARDVSHVRTAVIPVHCPQPGMICFETLTCWAATQSLQRSPIKQLTGVRMTVGLSLTAYRLMQVSAILSMSSESIRPHPCCPSFLGYILLQISLLAWSRCSCAVKAGGAHICISRCFLWMLARMMGRSVE